MVKIWLNTLPVNQPDTNHSIKANPMTDRVQSAASEISRSEGCWSSFKQWLGNSWLGQKFSSMGNAISNWWNGHGEYRTVNMNDILSKPPERRTGKEQILVKVYQGQLAATGQQAMERVSPSVVSTEDEISDEDMSGVEEVRVGNSNLYEVTKTEESIVEYIFDVATKIDATEDKSEKEKLRNQLEVLHNHVGTATPHYLMKTPIRQAKAGVAKLREALGPTWQKILDYKHPESAAAIAAKGERNFPVIHFNEFVEDEEGTELMIVSELPYEYQLLNAALVECLDGSRYPQMYPISLHNGEFSAIMNLLEAKMINSREAEDPCAIYSILTRFKGQMPTSDGLGPLDHANREGYLARVDAILAKAPDFVKRPLAIRVPDSP